MQTNLNPISPISITTPSPANKIPTAIALALKCIEHFRNQGFVIFMHPFSIPSDSVVRINEDEVAIDPTLSIIEVIMVSILKKPAPPNGLYKFTLTIKGKYNPGSIEFLSPSKPIVSNQCRKKNALMFPINNPFVEGSLSFLKVQLDLPTRIIDQLPVDLYYPPHKPLEEAHPELKDPTTTSDQTIDLIFKILLAVSEGLNFLHSYDLDYGRLNRDNIVVTPEGEILLKMFPRHPTQNTTPIPPYKILNKQTSDLWNFGQLIESFLPFMPEDSLYRAYLQHLLFNLPGETQQKRYTALQAMEILSAFESIRTNDSLNDVIKSLNFNSDNHCILARFVAKHCFSELENFHGRQMLCLLSPANIHIKGLGRIEIKSQLKNDLLDSESRYKQNQIDFFSLACVLTAIMVPEALENYDSIRSTGPMTFLNTYSPRVFDVEIQSMIKTLKSGEDVLYNLSLRPFFPVPELAMPSINEPPSVEIAPIWTLKEVISNKPHRKILRVRLHPSWDDRFNKKRNSDVILKIVCYTPSVTHSPSEAMSTDKKSLCRSIEILDKSYSPNLVTILATPKKDGIAYVMLEFMNQGTIKDVITKLEEAHISDKDMYIFVHAVIKQLMLGYFFLHECMNVTFRSSHLDHFLINNEGYVKLCGFSSLVWSENNTFVYNHSNDLQQDLKEFVDTLKQLLFDDGSNEKSEKAILRNRLSDIQKRGLEGLIDFLIDDEDSDFRWTVRQLQNSIAQLNAFENQSVSLEPAVSLKDVFNGIKIQMHRNNNINNLKKQIRSHLERLIFKYRLTISVTLKKYQLTINEIGLD